MLQHLAEVRDAAPATGRVAGFADADRLVTGSRNGGVSRSGRAVKDQRSCVEAFGMLAAAAGDRPLSGVAACGMLGDAALQRARLP
jgi:hypothetical protein